MEEKNVDALEDPMGRLRIGTIIEREAEGILRARGITPALPVMAERCGRGGAGNVPLTTNIYGLNMTQVPIYRYDVTVKAFFRKRDESIFEVNFTKKAFGDAIIVDRRNRSRDAFLVFQQLNQEFLKGPSCVYFDLQSILYSLFQLDVDEKDGAKFDLPADRFPSGFSNLVRCELTLRRVTDQFQVTMGDLSGVSRDLSQVEHSLSQFLDVAISQQIMFSPKEHVTLSSCLSYLMNPANHGFSKKDVTYFPHISAHLAIGSEKSVRFIEGPRGGRSSALIVDTKKTPFHIVETVLQKAMQLVRNINNVTDEDLLKLETVLTGLCVETTHSGRSRRFFIKGIERKNAKTQLIPEKGTVAEYFYDKYKITLSCPLAPLIWTRAKDNSRAFHPFELCTIMDNQRVKSQQQTPQLVQEMIKKCAVSPFILREQNDKMFKALCLDNRNPYLASAGLEVSEHPFTLNGRQLPPPDLQYSGSLIANVRTDSFTWAGKKFLIPRSCRNWTALAFMSSRPVLSYNSDVTEHQYTDFVNRFVSEANACGMRMSRPTVKFYKDESFHKVIEDACKNFEFVLVAHPGWTESLHGVLKSCERRHLVVTQALRMLTVVNVMSKRQSVTLSNILLKTNIKLGGINYSVSINSPGATDVLKLGTLFIGISSSHPGGRACDDRDKDAISKGESVKLVAPTIVGYSANYGLVHDFEFIGDFLCQEPLREEKVDLIGLIVGRCVKKYRENRKSEPRRIVIYRSGPGEGMFPMILKYEVPLIRLCLLDAKCGAQLNIVVPNKLQSIRFFNAKIDPNARAMDQNVKPGLVVDHSIVHPEFSEFFLNSHKALQGTAKTPKYTVVFNESKFNLAQLEAMTYTLCYGHQIVQMPTSIPSPVYVASRYAERGRKLYSNFKCTDGEQYDKAFGGSYGQINQKIGYYGTRLDNFRINA